jgi:hypothetical protein
MLAVFVQAHDTTVCVISWAATGSLAETVAGIGFERLDFASLQLRNPP